MTLIPARQSTALELAIGPILDADGVAVTGGVVGDFKIKKTTGNFAALNGSATLTHVSAGVYDLVLTTSDTDTVGLCCIAIDDTTNACASVYLQVIEEAVYDRDYAASATGIIGTAQTGDSYAIVNSGTHGNSALKTLIDAVDNFIDTEIADIQSRLPAALSGGNMPAVLANVAHGGSSARLQLGGGDGSNPSLYIHNSLWEAVRILSTADETSAVEIASQGAAATGVYINATNAGTGVYTEGGSASVIHQDEVLATNAGNQINLGTNQITAGVIANGAIDAATFAADVDAEARGWVGLASANLDTQLGDLPTNAEMEARTLPAANYFDPAADTVANVTTVGAVTGLTASNLDATVSSRSSHSAADVWASGTRTLTSFGTLVADIWAYAISTGHSAAKYMRNMGAVLLGKSSGLTSGAGTVVYRDVTDSTDQVTGTVNSDGNRTSTTPGS